MCVVTFPQFKYLQISAGFSTYYRKWTALPHVAQLGDSIVVLESINGTIHLWDHFSDQLLQVGAIASYPKSKRVYAASVKITNRWFSMCKGELLVN